MQKLGLRLLFVSILCCSFFSSADSAFALCDSGTCYVARDGSGDFNCDGSNDQVEINKAIDFVASSSSVNTVHLKGSATYVIDDPIYIKSDMILEGDSSATVMLAANANWSDLYQGLVDGKLAVSGSTGVKNITIRGFKIDGNRSNQTQGVGNGYYNAIKLYRGSNIEIYNMYLTNNLGDGVLIDYGSVSTYDANVRVHDNTIYKVGHDGVYLKRFVNASVYNNKITCNVNGGVRLYAVNHAKVYGNTINAEGSGGAGIAIGNGENAMLDDVEIYDNKVYETALWGILLEGGDANVTPANTKNVHIYHNLIFGTGTSYGDQKTGGVTLYGFHNTIIENNTFDYNRKAAIAVDNNFTNMPQYPDAVIEAGGFNTIVRNNIISHGRAYDYGSDHYGYGILNLVSDTHSFSVYNNCFYDNPGGNFKNVTAGTGNVYADPQYASWSIHQNTGTFSDYRLKSKAGRWNGSSWVSDTVSFPCIDAGYASSSYANEPAPNGSRINIGRYGNTNEASKSGSSPAPTPSTYTLTVNNGSGSGSYTFGTKVNIAVNPAISELVFDKWTGDTDAISTRTLSPDGTDITVYQPSVTITMPGKAITLTATYKDSPALTHVLTVNQGTGSGSYVSGKTISVSANLPASSSKVFDKWTGDTSYIASATSATTTVTMPNKAITLTATYKDVITTYYLTVNSGSGDGNYAPNTKVTITAAPAVSGMVFDKWTGDTDYLSSLNSSTTTLTMPTKAINITAYYVPVTAPETTYSLLVNFGSGDGKYTQGAKVTITADTPTGKVFDKWTGDTMYLSSTTSATATVTMPNKAITLNATYKTIAVVKYVLTVNQGTGDGSYAAGTQVTIKADTPATNQAFDKWTGDTDYISSATSSSATVTMPDKAITLTATYKSQDSSLPDGTLIKTPDSNKVYVVIGGEKKWLSTPEVFEQMGYAWSSIKIIATMDMANYTDFEDNLIRAIGEINVYLVINGTKRHIPNPQVFLSYGFSWNDIKEVTKEAKMRYKDAYLIRESGKQEVYYLNPAGVRKHIPSQTVFDSYQDQWSDVQIISSEEMKAHPVSNLIQLEGSSDVYLIENNVKRHISSPQSFSKYQLNWNHIIAVNRTEFDWYKTGIEVR